MLKYNFKSFFQDENGEKIEVLHNNQWAGNQYLIVDKSILTKAQREYVEKFDRVIESKEKIVDGYLQQGAEKSKELDESMLFKPTHIAKYTEKFNKVYDEKSNTSLNENFYNFLVKRKCQIYNGDGKHRPLIICKEVEFIGIVLPLRNEFTPQEFAKNFRPIEEYYSELKAEQDARKDVKLMKPLFVKGNYNREGKRTRARLLKTIGKYNIWISAGKPDNSYPANDKDQYYLYVQKDEWIVPLGATEHRLELNAKDEKEQAKLIDSFIESAKKQYVEARDGKGTFPNFIGALFLNELDRCGELAKIRQEEDRKRRQEEDEERQRQKELKVEQEKQETINRMVKTEEVFKTGGTIKNGDVIIDLAEKYNINIPLRTKGWILNDLAELTITEDGSVSYRYYKRTKNTRGSQKVYEVAHDLRKAICG